MRVRRGVSSLNSDTETTPQDDLWRERPVEKRVSRQEIEEKLQALRDEYRTASEKRRSIITLQGKSLLNAKEILEKRRLFQAP